MERSAPELRERAEAHERATSEFLRVKRAKLARERAATRAHGDARVARQQERERANRASAAASRAKIVCYARELERRTDRLELDRNRHCARADRAERKLAVLRDEARRLKTVLRALWERKHPDTCAYLVDSNALFLLASQAEADSDSDEPSPDTPKPEPAVAALHPSPLPPPPRLSPPYPQPSMRPALHAPPPPPLPPSTPLTASQSHTTRAPPPRSSPPGAHIVPSPHAVQALSQPPLSKTTAASSAVGGGFYVGTAARPRPGAPSLVGNTTAATRSFTLPQLVHEAHGGAQRSSNSAIGGSVPSTYSTPMTAYPPSSASYSTSSAAYSAPTQTYIPSPGVYSARAPGYQAGRTGAVFASASSPAPRRAYVLPPPPPPVDRSAGTQYKPSVSGTVELTTSGAIDMRYASTAAMATAPSNVGSLEPTPPYASSATGATNGSSFPPMRVHSEEAVRRGDDGKSR